MAVNAVRIADPHVIKLIEEERLRSGESTPTKTAQRMIVERATQREMLDRDQKSAPQAASA